MITCKTCGKAIRGNAGAEDYDEDKQVMSFTCKRCSGLFNAASRAEQQGRYIDSGPQNWDDRDNPDY